MGRNAQSSADFEDDASEMFKCHQEMSIKQKDRQERWYSIRPLFLNMG